ncbi:hypothetical protein ELS19_12745 [Halogeometricum borinquense]|uniref:Uncharacterized protein n=1 Tax=Halogeometricum borinquense TaxID=60847 RepID=A0A482TL99_9EURY|nr:hypothetical protein [Halogeometricum borinquense]RYJ14733.1 hypothetical protein ELS19_12745 [Halogeometricum borinquense]
MRDALGVPGIRTARKRASRNDSGSVSSHHRRTTSYPLPKRGVNGVSVAGMLPATFVILRAARVGDESRVSGAGERYEWNTGGSGSKTNTRE